MHELDHSLHRPRKGLNLLTLASATYILMQTRDAATREQKLLRFGGLFALVKHGWDRSHLPGRIELATPRARIVLGRFARWTVRLGRVNADKLQERVAEARPQDFAAVASALVTLILTH